MSLYSPGMLMLDTVLSCLFSSATILLWLLRLSGRSGLGR